MTNKNIILRKAEEKDIDKIHEWWTNGSIMSSVGFPKGLNKKRIVIIHDNIARKLNKRENT